jgi:hypothetical protein
MMGLPEHRFHALIAQERFESRRSSMVASRRRRHRRDEAREQAGRVLPRLSLDRESGALYRRTA